jgi:SAM-dependent methyltransferase
MGTSNFFRQAISAVAWKFGYEFVHGGVRHHAYTLVSETLFAAEADAKRGDLSAALARLRELPLDHLGHLLLHIPKEFEALQSFLPTMPPREVQMSWTGSAGLALLRQSCAFVRSAEATFSRATATDLRGKRILDYGCGWGRLLRLMYHYSAPESLYGVDAWDKSIAICRQTGLLGNIELCDSLPASLPFGGTQFDLIYAFSVFTHLSQRASDIVQATIRARIKENGLFVLTVRPIEHWRHWSRAKEKAISASLMEEHRRKGFAFASYPPGEQGPDYGEASMSLDYIESRWTNWSLFGFDHSLIDPDQLVVFLRPR